MKVAISSKGTELNSQVDVRFGRGEYFVIIDGDNVTSMENQAKFAQHGAGGEVVRLLSNENIDVILTGEVGPNAGIALDSFEIKAFRGISGTVEETYNKWKNGELEEVKGATTDSHNGLK